MNITALVKKAQNLYFLRMLRKVNLSQRLLLSFYRCSIKSILTHGMLVWYGNSSAADKKALQRVIKTAQNIITKQQLPALDNIFTSCWLQKIHNILKDYILYWALSTLFYSAQCKIIIIIIIIIPYVQYGPYLITIIIFIIIV